MEDLICRNCGNTGTGFDGTPCVCKLTPEWQQIVGTLRRENGVQFRTIRRMRSFMAEVSKKHDEPCRYDHNDFCQAHCCSKPCLFERIAAELR